jgi:uncharacterized protein
MRRHLVAARLRKGIDRLGLLQIDSVNILVRAQYLPFFSRLGSYEPARLDALGGQAEALLRISGARSVSAANRVPASAALAYGARASGAGRVAAGGEAGRGRCHARIEAEGPLAASDVAGSKASKGMWVWSAAKHALEWLFWAGLVAATHRRGSFERVYDLPERVLPRATLQLPTPSGDARRTLLARSARALGVATADDMRDYYSIPAADARLPIEQLVEKGTIIPVSVRGWQQAYLHQDARPGRKLEGSALLSPFDPLIWHPRTGRLFGFRCRLEIYTPVHKREHGYYVLPFLLDGGLGARVDLKADRKAGTLIVQRAHVEPGAPQCTVERQIEEIRLMASWLGLSSLAIAPVAAIERLFTTLHVAAHPAFVELATAQSEMAFYG